MHNITKLTLTKVITIFVVLSSFIGLSGCSTVDTKPNAETVVYENGYQASELDYLFNLVKDNVPSLTELSNFPGQMSSSLNDFKLKGDYPDLWHRITNGYALEYDEDNERIQTAIKRFSKYTRYFDIISTKAHPYLYHIVVEAEKRGIPLELALLPAIESSFEPTALSSRSAAGLWQFMPETGRHFGLARNKWYDGRRDVFASTTAALDYLKKLHTFFDGDWLLAIGAYNYGEGNMQKAIERNEAAGKPTDFWSLSLPTETSQFVPSLIAVSKIIANPEKYGVTLNHIADEPYLTQLTLDGQISLSLAAKLADVPVSDFKRINSGYRRTTTGPYGPHCITLPISKINGFKQSLANLSPDEFMSTEMVALADIIEKEEQENRKSEERENRKSIAQIDTKASRKSDEQTNRKSTAQKTDKKADRESKTGKKSDVKTASYKVNRGDTLFNIAQRHGMSAKELRNLNGMKSDYLKVGQVVKVSDTRNQTEKVARAENTQSTAKFKSTQGYTVKKGDTLMQVAKRYNITIAELRRLNGIQNNQIRVGQSLKIPGGNGGPRTTTADNSKKENDRKRVVHTVKPGESLWGIARHYEVSVDKISQWNKLQKRGGLRLGQELTIWRDS